MGENAMQIAFSDMKMTQCFFTTIQRIDLKILIELANKEKIHQKNLFHHIRDIREQNQEQLIKKYKNENTEYVIGICTIQETKEYNPIESIFAKVLRNGSMMWYFSEQKIDNSTIQEENKISCENDSISCKTIFT